MAVDVWVLKSQFKDDSKHILVKAFIKFSFSLSLPFVTTPESPVFANIHVY